MTTASDLILPVRKVSRDGGEYVVRCPHCKAVIGIEGNGLSEIRGEQYQHTRRERTGYDGKPRYIGCGGWLEIMRGAVYVKELT